MNLPSGLIEKESPLKIMRRFRDSNPLVLIGRLNERTTTTNWSITSAFLHLHKSRDWSLLGHQKSFFFSLPSSFLAHTFHHFRHHREKKKRREKCFIAPPPHLLTVFFLSASSVTFATFFFLLGCVPPP